MASPHIHVLCPDNDRPSGGIKILYRHVDVLTRNGFSASILHQQPGFRCTWFANSTPIRYLSDVRLAQTDFLVIPEIYGPNIAALRDLPGIGPGGRKVIFNQNAYYTFLGHSLDAVEHPAFAMPYEMGPEFVAMLVVSEDSRRYLEYAFPDAPVHRIRNAIDASLFAFREEKVRQICFMPRKHPEDALQVLALLRLRGALDGVRVRAIEHMSEREVAEIMQESLIFLSFGYPEGCPLPPAEAMACGCLVVGYDGFGGREYFREEFSHPVPVGDIVSYATAVEQLLAAHARDPGTLRERARRASHYIQEHYSQVNEEHDIVGCWERLCRQHSSPR
ncbi:MAG: glycosyltransferase family 4 protein [Gammaproteobacteria bacterium]